MILENGYQMQTTFIRDFAIANRFGVFAIVDTFDRALKEWRNNIVYMTELVIATNRFIWYFYEKGNHGLAEVYDRLWRQAEQAVYENKNFTPEDMHFFYETTD